MPQEILQQYFGYDRFRKGQEELISSILSGRDTVGIMPTGAGKSICYQVPALMLEGLTIVISPLISLMQDQVDALRMNGIPAAFLNSSLSADEYRATLSQVYSGNVKLLYAAPERLETESFLHIAEQLPISMITVDEAHCVSQWGQDFRPSYLKIAEFLHLLPYRPRISAFTATATKEVCEDIVRILGLHDPFTLTTGFDRENLYFGVQQPRDKFHALMQIISSHPEQSGIVYCLTRKLVEQVCEELCENGISAVRYHAGLPDEERRVNQEAFLYDRVSVMVATNAFGMGIDKSNVSFVVHYNMPKNLESYYQEAGRAGRDGSPADCILLYSGRDVRTNQFLIDHSSDNAELDETTRALIRQRDEERLKQMTFYATRQSCLRQFMLEYFGESAKNYCSNCSCCKTNYEQRDMTLEAQKIISCIYRLQQRDLQFGAAAVTDILRGSKAEKYAKFRFADTLSTYGIMSDVSEKLCREMIRHLLAEEWISQTGEFHVLALNRNSARLLREKCTITLNVVKEAPPPEKKTKSEAVSEHPELFEELKKCRAGIAAKERVPAYIIFTDAALRDMCEKLPINEMAFLSVSGVGRRKLEKYGDPFMDVIRTYIKEHPEI
ncbi:MAG: DNA helicase RecQ [Oscillospiraceae bacterium]|nr:DNA helicase RecQ [Oscillospiraceae bacterium]